MPSKKVESFEGKLQKLEEVVAWFESDDVTLEQSMAKFEDGMKLAQELEKELTEVENRIQVIKQKFEQA